jgi:serine/threonine protein phosphatase PrpC
VIAYECVSRERSRESGVVRLTKDHKLGEEEEKARIINAGVKVSEGQTRINGISFSLFILC